MHWENLERLQRTDDLKVVLADRDDYEWARELVRERGLAERCAVLLSPVHGRLDRARSAADPGAASTCASRCSSTNTCAGRERGGERTAAGRRVLSGGMDSAVTAAIAAADHRWPCSTRATGSAPRPASGRPSRPWPATRRAAHAGGRAAVLAAIGGSSLTTAASRAAKASRSRV